MLEGLLRLGSEELWLVLGLLRHRGVVESVHDPPLSVHVARDPDEGDAATQLVLYPLLQCQQFFLHLPYLVVDLLLLTEQLLLRLRGSHELLESLQVLQLLLERRLLELDLLLFQLLREEVSTEGVDVGVAPSAQEDEQERQHGGCSTVCDRVRSCAGAAWARRADGSGAGAMTSPPGPLGASSPSSKYELASQRVSSSINQLQPNEWSNVSSSQTERFPFCHSCSSNPAVVYLI